MKKLGRTACVVVLAISMMIVSMPVFAQEAAPQSADAYKLYITAAKKVQKAKSIVISGTGKMNGSFDDETIEANAKIETQILYNDKNELQMASFTTNDDGSKDATYYKGGYTYSDYVGYKIKRKSSDDKALMNSLVMNPNLPKELFKDAVVEDVEFGKRIKLTLDSKSLNDLFYGFYDEMTEDPDADVRFSKILVYITIGNDGGIRSYRIAFNMSAESGGLTGSAKFSATMNIVFLDKLTKIDFPTDLSSYKKM